MRSHVDHRESGAGGEADAHVPAQVARRPQSGRLTPDEGTLRAAYRWLVPIRDWYFRAEVDGIARVPDEPTLLVGNHDGGYFPPDAIVLGMAWHERFAFKRPLFTLMHDIPFRLTEQLRSWLYKLGMVPASKHNLGRIFDQGDSLLVYPGGAYEAFRPFVHRRRIELGHRTGFIKHSLERRVPITPVVSVGAHDTLVVLSRGAWLAKKIPLARKLRTDVMPLWIGLPWGIGFGPLPHLPLPSKVKVEVLEPIRLWRELGETADTQDPRVLTAGLDIVRKRMQAVSDRMYAARRWPVLG